jgi:GntR family transcriptional regulator
MILRIDRTSADPPHTQITRQIIRLIADGALASGERLPTVRQLAADLEIAPNTVARSYRDLENAGLIQSSGRRGTVVSGRAHSAERQRREDVIRAAHAFRDAMRAAGISRDEAVEAVRSAWNHP